MSIFCVEGTVKYAVAVTGTAMIAHSRPASCKKRDLYNDWIDFAPIEPQGGSSLTQSVRDLLRITGWSNRRLASVLGTTHPTIASILRGNVPDRVSGLVEVVPNLLNLINRIWILCGEDKAKLASVMKSGTGKDNVMSLAGSAQYGSAYLAAVEFLSPRQAHAPLAIARIARNPSDDVIALGDDYGE